MFNFSKALNTYALNISKFYFETVLEEKYKNCKNVLNVNKYINIFRFLSL